jgi:hypothetical protein
LRFSRPLASPTAGTIPAVTGVPPNGGQGADLAILAGIRAGKELRELIEECFPDLIAGLPPKMPPAASIGHRRHRRA